MEESEYNITRKKAIEAIIYCANNGMKQIEMREAVNNYMEECGANITSIGGENTVISHRKMAAKRLAIDSMYAISKEKQCNVDRQLERIAENLF